MVFIVVFDLSLFCVMYWHKIAMLSYFRTGSRKTHGTETSDLNC